MVVGRKLDRPLPLFTGSVPMEGVEGKRVGFSIAVCDFV
jgi:hypothetical protein